MVDKIEVTRSLAQLSAGCYIFEYYNKGKGGVEHVKKTEHGYWRSLDHPGQAANLHRRIIGIKRYQCDEGSLIKSSKQEKFQTVTYCGLCDRVI